MKFTCPIVALSMLLTACRTTPSDSTIQQEFVGTWTFTVDGVNFRTFENNKDGSYVIETPISPTNAARAKEKGTWQVKGGFVIGTPTRAAWPEDTLQVWSNKVVSIGDNRMVLLTPGGRTNVITLHKEQ